MTSIASWLWGTSQLDDAVDKATSELLPAGAEDIALNLEICDQIRSKSVPVKDAMRALKRRLNHKNPNVQNLALSLTDTCIKNGGDLFLIEIASREFMDNLVSILKIPALNLDVKNNVLRMIQNWNYAFEAKPALSYVNHVYKSLLAEGFRFPPKDLSIASAVMVDTQTAPEWIDSDVCLRCRTPFTFTNRKHHCRNCGQVFDQACSSKSMPLPHFGITQDVRVCDGCYNKITRKAERADRGHHQPTISPTVSNAAPRHRSARDLADGDLQRAIQLSLQDAGSSARSGYVPYQPPHGSFQPSEPPLVDRASRPSVVAEEDDDPDLKAAIEASLREMNAPKPSAPIALEPPYHPVPAPVPPAPAPSIPNYDLAPLESDAILTFSQTIAHVEASGGRDISRYPAVNELYDKANNARPKLALSLDDAGRKEQMLSDMHDKLSQAVKLYDQLLTTQIANPPWRSPVATAASGYSHWAASVSPYQQWQPTSAPAEQRHQYITSPAPEPQPQQQPYAPAPPAPVQPRHATYIEPIHQTPSLPPVSLNPHQHQYTPPVAGLVLSPPPPPPLQHPASPRVQRHALHRAKTVTFSPAPPTVAASAPAPAEPANNHLGRSNTVSARPGHASWAPSLRQSSLEQQQQLHLQQQLMQAPAPPTNVIPVHEFPAVPTEVPQQYAEVYAGGMGGSGYGVVQQEERKEALLIDL